MIKRYFKASAELTRQIKWIILSRVVFAAVLIFACLIFSIAQDKSFFSRPFLHLYNIAGASLVLSIVYLVWLNKWRYHKILAYVQIIIDTFGVTGIIFVTGGYNSFFTFLYLVVIIYTSMLLLQKGSLIIAALSSIQYGILIEMEYYRLIAPYPKDFFLSTAVSESQIIYRIIMVIVACFAVSVLSGILAAQLTGVRQDLKITQEHLKRVEKLAAVDEMIAGIAHEVKNPLASLSGSIQLLKEDTRPGSYEDKLMQIILRETDRLKQIVNDLRYFASPNMQNAQDTLLAPVIEETVELFLKDPEWENRIQVKLRVDHAVCAFIDPSHFTQILWNLLKNAAQSIKNNGAIIIGLAQYRNNRIHLTVKDTGEGIDTDQIGHIFDPFFTTKPDGTGLGLSIIHRLVDMYNGMIDVESTPGKGTVFTVLFKKSPGGEKSKS